MVTVSVAAILMAIGAPGLQQAVASQRVKTLAYEIIADLTLARSEALKRGEDVIITPAGDGWAAGWAVQTATNVMISKKNPSGAGVDFTQSPGTITFDRNGRVSGALTTTRFGFGDGGANRRCISLDPAGRPKSVRSECPT